MQVGPQQAKEEKARRTLQRNFSLYKHYMFKRYIHAPHLDLFDEYLMRVVQHVETAGREGIAFLVSEMPPRHGKTLNIGRFLTSWFLGRNPDYRVMYVSYGATLANKSSRLSRNLMSAPMYKAVFPDVVVDPRSSAADAWNIFNHEGGMDAMGVLGGATGKGAHLLIADDLIKNREEAESEVIREKTWDAFIDDLLTRLEPGGAVILNATRWHQDDPIGRVLKRLVHIYGDRFARLRFPALAEENDVLGRKVGEALWPARYPIDVLKRIESTMGGYSWSALYMQNPTPAEGGIFKRAWFHPVDNLPRMVHTVRYWDLAMSEKTTADYTVGVKIGQGEDGHYYILDVARFQKEWGDVVPEIARVAIADGARTVIGVEEAGYMSRAVQELNTDPRLHGYALFGYPVDKDKVTRALPFAARLSAGNVSVLNTHWTQDYLDEMCSFPNGTNDDQVDASSGAWAMLGSGVDAGAYQEHSEQNYFYVY